MARSSEAKKSPPIFLMCLILFGVPAAVVAWQGDYVFAAVLGLIGFGCFSGFKVGAVRTLAIVAGIIAAVWFSSQLSVDFQVEQKLTQLISTTGLTNRLLALGLVSLTIILATFLVVAFISGWNFKSRPGIGTFNRCMGFFMGGAEAGVGALVLLGGLFVVQPMLSTASSEEAPVQHAITTSVATVIERTERSRVGPVVEKYNPFVKFPQLNCFAQVQKTVAVLQDPEAVKRMINDPRINALQDDPSMQEAIGMLKSDKTIAEILESGGLNDQEKIMAVMNSPVVLHLMDQPGFIAEASKVIADM